MRALIIFILIISNFCFCGKTHQTTFQHRPIKVLIIIFNPIIESKNHQKLTDLFNWYDPDSLSRVYISDLEEVSGGQLTYQIVKRLEVDEFPVKLDGFRCDDQSFLLCWENRQECHQPDQVDYNAIIKDFNIISQIEQGAIDEVWLFGFPYGGFWESTMAGKDAFFCNSDPIPDTDYCSRRFIIMGFNYERGVGCMLEDFGHRTESIMSHVFKNVKKEDNLWEKFILYDKVASGKSNCGNVHFAPNSEKDYDWGNERYVLSNCDDWFNFPDFKGIVRKVNCKEWGNGDIREHHKWWLKHIPKAEGTTNGIFNNWWYYMIDCNNN